MIENQGLQYSCTIKATNLGRWGEGDKSEKQKNPQTCKKTSGFRPILTPDQLGAPLTDYKEKTPKSNPDFLKLKIFYFEHIQPGLAGRR